MYTRLLVGVGEKTEYKEPSQENDWAFDFTIENKNKKMNENKNKNENENENKNENKNENLEERMKL